MVQWSGPPFFLKDLQGKTSTQPSMPEEVEALHSLPSSLDELERFRTGALHPFLGLLRTNFVTRFFVEVLADSSLSCWAKSLVQSKILPFGRTNRRLQALRTGDGN